MRYSDTPAARATIEITATPQTVWALVSDVALMAKLSEELLEVQWLDGDTEPAVGRRFSGRSYHPVLGEWDSVSTVTCFDAPHQFTWEVNAGQDPDHPSSTWGFDLRPTAAGTELSQWGRIGPARSGLSYAIDRLPDKEEKIVRNRLREFQTGLESNLAAIKDLAKGRGH